MKILHKVAHILLIVGGLNWLLTGLFNGWDLAKFLGTPISIVIYVLVGFSAVYELVTIKDCDCCQEKTTPKVTPTPDM